MVWSAPSSASGKREKREAHGAIDPRELRQVVEMHDHREIQHQIASDVRERAKSVQRGELMGGENVDIPGRRERVEPVDLDQRVQTGQVKPSPPVTPRRPSIRSSAPSCVTSIPGGGPARARSAILRRRASRCPRPGCSARRSSILRARSGARAPGFGDWKLPAQPRRTLPGRAGLERSARREDAGLRAS